MGFQWLKGVNVQQGGAVVGIKFRTQFSSVLFKLLPGSQWSPPLPPLFVCFMDQTKQPYLLLHYTLYTIHYILYTIRVWFGIILWYVIVLKIFLEIMFTRSNQIEKPVLIVNRDSIHSHKQLEESE